RQDAGRNGSGEAPRRAYRTAPARPGRRTCPARRRARRLAQEGSGAAQGEHPDARQAAQDGRRLTPTTAPAGCRQRSRQPERWRNEESTMPTIEVEPRALNTILLTFGVSESIWRKLCRKVRRAGVEPFDEVRRAALEDWFQHQAA